MNIPAHLKGLTETELKASRKKYGYNQVDKEKKNKAYELLLDILKEPMLILLIAISVIYLLVGDYADAAFMLTSIILVSAISFHQDNRSKKALEELEKLNEPLSTVIREAKVMQVPTREIAVGDLCLTEEGKIINADGRVVYSNDYSVNEASLTGESFSIFKSSDSDDNRVYSGTVSISGLAVFEVEKIGKETRIGKIAESIQHIKQPSSPLQIQIGKFVKTMAIMGLIVFMMVCGYRYIQTHNAVESLLNGLTLAMSVLPEEIPVAFTTFMALGAWKLMREGIIIKHSGIVETLGSTTVICTDKTGTITENSMRLKLLYDHKTDQTYDERKFSDKNLAELITYAMWSSEPVPFDPMEKTLHQVYAQTQKEDQRKNFQMVHEYPLEGKPPMMTHLFENRNHERIIAAKGAPEAILAVCQLSSAEKENVRQQVSLAGKQGYRVLGVAKSSFQGPDFPAAQQKFTFQFLGLTIFYDPPKKGIQEVFRKTYDARIKVKVITGDNADTTQSIAAQAGIINTTHTVNGNEIAQYSEEELTELAHKTTLFTRMFPEAKLAIVNALKKSGEVVAMLGDGVNDAPALKAAHIGVAMGSKGTEIAKAAASLVIVNDDLDKLITGIAAGRRIYSNIKKAIQYIISIHIPIILTVSLPLFLGWVYPEIFSPVHVIFLELIMGPTCSIVYENEPMEKNTMLQKPRIMTDTFLSWRELWISITQGIAITVGVLIVYQWVVQHDGNEEKTRAMVFCTLILANILLSFTNRSFRYSIFESFKNKNPLLAGVTSITLGLLATILYVPSVTHLFRVTTLSTAELGVALITACVSVLWFEVFKLVKRLTDKKPAMN
ncbi:MAG: P-type ATPase [Cytophagales bacterium]|jgi:Ca2+-transporting ATPase|nr:cation-translocating P-type ATPase [Bacteroidota bacterium]MBS1982085.1 cation-translocating P-type ATPase [Bacteroidota bacterium]WHZ06443.1 MAG: P-type ATPase [Cytophagales bacterium]